MQITHSVAHYLMAIHRLELKNGYVRLTDIAKDLDISKGSTSIALKSLKEQGLVVEDENRILKLSKKAHDEVHNVNVATYLLYHFFKTVLNLNDKISREKACQIDYILGKEVLEALFSHMKKQHFQDIQKITKFKNYQEFYEQFPNSQDFDAFIKSAKMN